MSLDGSLVEIRPLRRPGDLGWVVMAHGERYAAEFGWDMAFEVLVAGIVGRFAQTIDTERQQGWIAEQGGQRVGCVLCTEASPTVGQLRLLLVGPSPRGAGIGRRLVDTCIEHARSVGYQRLTLWTNHPLLDAGRLYRRAGFILTGEEPHRNFGVDLIGQTYDLDLRAAPKSDLGVGT